MLYWLVARAGRFALVVRFHSVINSIYLRPVHRRIRPWYNLSVCRASLSPVRLVANSRPFRNRGKPSILITAAVVQSRPRQAGPFLLPAGGDDSPRSRGKVWEIGKKWNSLIFVLDYRYNNRREGVWMTRGKNLRGMGYKIIVISISKSIGIIRRLY